MLSFSETFQNKSKFISRRMFRIIRNDFLLVTDLASDSCGAMLSGKSGGFCEVMG